MILSGGQTRRRDHSAAQRAPQRHQRAHVLTGAIPVYVNPQMNDRLGISLGMSVADVKAAIEKHPSAKAVLVNNPTYYGICSNIREIVRLAHAEA